MACVKPEPLHLVVYMHIPPIRFPKPNKRLWRTPQGSYRRGNRPSGLLADRSTPRQAGGKTGEGGSHGPLERGYARKMDRTRPFAGSEMWNQWIRGAITVTT